MTKKKEYCKKCGREYDGHYPCLCGSKGFVYKNKLKQDFRFYE